MSFTNQPTFLEALFNKIRLNESIINSFSTYHGPPRVIYCYGLFEEQNAILISDLFRSLTVAQQRKVCFPDQVKEFYDGLAEDQLIILSKSGNQVWSLLENEVTALNETYNRFWPSRSRFLLFSTDYVPLTIKSYMSFMSIKIDVKRTIWNTKKYVSQTTVLSKE